MDAVPLLGDIFKLKNVKSIISNYYREQFDSSFGAYQVSAYRNYKNGENPTAHATWHNDTLPLYAKKLLIYLSDILTEEDGPTQIKLPNGTIKSIYGKAGTAMFIDINLHHRAHQISDSSLNNSRDMLNFEFCPVDYNDEQLIQSLGGDVIYPIDLNSAFDIETTQIKF